MSHRVYQLDPSGPRTAEPRRTPRALIWGGVALATLAFGTGATALILQHRRPALRVAQSPSPAAAVAPRQQITQPASSGVTVRNIPFEGEVGQWKAEQARASTAPQGATGTPAGQPAPAGALPPSQQPAGAFGGGQPAMQPTSQPGFQTGFQPAPLGPGQAGLQGGNPAAPQGVGGQPAQSAADVVARVKGSTVLILVKTSDGAVSGTGFVAAPGQVATCHHVVEDALEIAVITADRRRVAATFRSGDAANDVALLNCGAGLPAPLPLGSYNQVREGDEIGVTGFPQFGSFVLTGFDIAASSSFGRVSAKRTRDVNGYRVDVLQTNAPINGGNSGGPVYLMSDGRVIGLAAAKLRSAEGIGFASSIDALRRLR